MKRLWIFVTIGLGMVFLFACSSTIVTPPDATATRPKATATQPSAPTLTPIPQVTTIQTQNTQEPATFFLSEPGPYFVGNRVHTIADDRRNGREIELLIWYPALEHSDADGKPIVRNAAVDSQGAPYPLILTGEETGRYLFRSHLASHGFILAVVRSSYPPDHVSFNVGGAQDFIFALDQLASTPPSELAGAIDTEHVGVAGYAWDGGVALAVSGARVDPQFYLSQCEQPSPMISSFPTDWLEEICSMAEKWDEFALHIGDEITASDDGLWQPITDDRILAVMPMTLDGAWLFGERGLMSVDRPTLMLCATKALVQLENAYTFEHLGTPERSMISWVERSDGMVFGPEVAGQMNHFVTAFFGYHLQGIEAYAAYFSEDFVAQFEDLAWGVYSDE
jgi:predicted dienelactone hydrolase